MSPFFSIIIPAYNVAKYVEPLFKALNNSTFTDFEAIFVVEESTDNSLEIITQAAQLNPRFSVYSKACSGSASAPRNFGMQYAKGEYIWFVDADDSLEEGALAILHEHILKNKDCDLVIFGAKDLFVNDDGSVTDPKIIPGLDKLMKIKEQLSGIELFEYIYAKRFLPFVAPWFNVFRRDLFFQHDLNFIEGVRFEDIEWVMKLHFFAQKITFIDDSLYLYCRREGSMFTTINANTLWQLVTVLAAMGNFGLDNNMPVNVRRLWVSSFLASYFIWFFAPDVNDGQKIMLKETRSLVKQIGTLRFYKLLWHKNSNTNRLAIVPMFIYIITGSRALLNLFVNVIFYRRVSLMKWLFGKKKRR